MKHNLQQGQMLVSLILISIIGITIATGAMIVVMVNSQSGMQYQQGEVAYSIAQSGVENALLRLLRDPSYPGETNMQVGGGTVDISVSSSSGTFTSYVATASGKFGNYVRKIQVNAHFIYDTRSELVVDSRREIY